MANVSYDTLTIQINADSKQANNSINALSKNLQKLDEVAKKLDKEKVEEVKTLLVDIANIDFSNVSKGLQDVVNAFKSLQAKANSKSVQNALSGSYTNRSGLSSKADVDLSGYEIGGGDINNATKLLWEYRNNIYETANALSNITQHTIEWRSATDLALNSVESALTPYEQLGQKLGEIGLNATQTSIVMRALNRDIDTFSPDQLHAIREILSEMGFEAEEIDIILKDLKLTSKDLDENLKKSSRSLGKMFANIMKYRVIRKLIQMIFQSITNGIKEIALVDEQTNKAISNIKNSFQYMTNSIVSVLAPLLQMVAPLITMITDAVSEFSSEMAEMFAVMNGQDQFAKATKSAEDYADALKKTQSIGIDELNVLNQDQNGFEMVDTDASKFSGFKSFFDEFGEVIAKIKDAVGRVLKAAKDFLTRILPAISRLLEPILNIIGNILDLVMTLIDMTFEDVNQSLVDFTDMIAQIFTFISDIVVSLMPILMQVIHQIAPLLNIINTALSFIFQLIGGIFKLLSPIVKFIGVLLTPLSAILTIASTLFYVIQGIFETLKKLFTFDWFSIGDTWKKVGNQIAQAWIDMAKTSEEVWKNANIGEFATGGFPEDGLFFANHNELVGKFSNGATAVANNEQIVEGIKQGVLEAMLQSGSGNIQVIIDGQEVAKIVERDMNGHGSDLVYGGAIRYGK